MIKAEYSVTQRVGVTRIHRIYEQSQEEQLGEVAQGRADLGRVGS